MWNGLKTNFFFFFKVENSRWAISFPVACMGSSWGWWGDVCYEFKGIPIGGLAWKEVKLILWRLDGYGASCDAWCISCDSWFTSWALSFFARGKGSILRVTKKVWWFIIYQLKVALLQNKSWPCWGNNSVMHPLLPEQLGCKRHSWQFGL